MADQVEEVKNKTDIVALIGESLTLNKAGRNFKANCPFHSERTPSFMVSPELQIYKCFGCGESGDVFTFLQKHEGMDFYEALQFLAKRAGVELKREFQGQKSFKEKYHEINSQAARFYQFLLLKHKSGQDALHYLTKERGLTLETIKAFQLGFAPEAAAPLFSFLKDKKGFLPQDIITAGLAGASRGRNFDRFRGRVIFPIFDHRGNTIALAGRILPGAKKELAKYINSPETPVYIKSDVLYGLQATKGEIKRLRKAILVEGEFDFLSLWQAGIKPVVAIKGTALTAGQANLLSRFADEVHLSLDRDAAGDLASQRGIAVAQKANLEVKVIKMADFKDPDDFVRRDPEGLKEKLKNPVSVWDFLFDLAFSKGDPATGEGKKIISRELLPTFSLIEDQIVLAHYVNLAASRFGIAPEAILQEMRKFSGGKKRTPEKVQTREEEKSKPRRQLLEENLLALCFQVDPELLGKNEVKEIITSPRPQRLLAEYGRFMQKRDKFNLRGFSSFLPAELKEGFSDLVFAWEEGISRDKIKKEIKALIREINLLEIKEKLAEKEKKIKEAEEQGKKTVLKKEQKEFTELLRKLKALE